MALEHLGIQQVQGEFADTEEMTRLVHAQTRLMESLDLVPRPRTQVKKNQEDPEVLQSRLNDPTNWKNNP